MSETGGPQGPQPTEPRDDASATTPTAGETEAAGRPRWLVPTIIAAAVVVVGVVVAIVLTQGGDEDATPSPTATTIQLESPAPTVEPAAREAETAFAASLPTSVLQYALATSVPDESWVDAGALEAYAETYTDGSGGEFAVLAGQWETADDAAAVVASVVGDLPVVEPEPSAEATATDGASAEPGPASPALPQSGDVTVGDEVVGTFTVVDNGDGTGTAVWSNATTVFHAVGPVEDVANFYAAFPL